MAKPLGPKSRLIRDAIAAHPSLANKELAEFINSSPARKEDGIEVTPMDVAQQKQAMKKMGFEPAAPAPAKKRGRPKAINTAAPAPAPAPKTQKASGSPVDLIDKVFDLAKQSGGVVALKRLVDRIAEMEKK